MDFNILMVWGIVDYYICILKIIDYFGKKILKKFIEGCNKRIKFKEWKDKCKVEFLGGRKWKIGDLIREIEGFYYKYVVIFLYGLEF